VSAEKSIVITGASSGIGAALTKAFARDGQRLFICARRSDRLAQVARDLPSVFHAACDVTHESEVESFFARVRERTPSVDVLIHCAAVMGPIGPITEIDSEAWLSALRTDLFSAVLVIKHVVPLMKRERRPRILLLSGGGAFDPMPNLSAYGVSKAGIVRLAETLAVELAPRNIAVNVFAPGFVATQIFDEMLEAGRERGGAIYDTVVKLLSEWGEDDIAAPIECARYLISEAAAELTGKTISARFDPWDEPEFGECLRDIVRSRIYATQRTNLDHVKGEAFAARLAEAVERRNRRRNAAGAAAKLR
jgi:NAD(P)-dependent dehydrogenase (short-subunit alcohol dehydrogenase family)